MKIQWMWLALAALPAVASADEVMPRFDVPAHCKAVAELGGTHSAMMEEQCMKMEQADYNALKPRWAELPSSVREHCIQIAGFGGRPSYMMLNQCVKMELEAGSAGTEFKF
jgi:hypothetical protein